jgi:hypothetical protein
MKVHDKLSGHQLLKKDLASLNLSSFLQKRRELKLSPDRVRRRNIVITLMILKV